MAAPERDVYETPDVPGGGDGAGGDGADAAGTPLPAHEDISTAAVDVGTARELFRTAAASDWRRHGLRDATVLELLGSDELARETPVQRYRRLNVELAQLTADLAAQPADGQLEDKVSVGELRAHVQRLQTSLDALAPAATSSSATEGGTMVSAAAGAGQLISQIQTVQARARQASPATATSSSTGPTTLTYELYYDSQVAASSTAAQLEARLAALEAAIGPVPYEELGVTTLSAAMAAVSARVALLDPKRLELLSLRIKAINSDLERQATLRLQQPAAAAEIDAKVQAIYDKMERWDPLVDTLPALIDRLRALQQVHQDAATMVQAVKAIEAEQAAVRDLLTTSKAVSETLQQSMAANAAAVQHNLEATDARIKALAAKLERLGAP